MSSNYRPSSSQQSARQQRLSADGELPDLDALLESAHDETPEAIAYCIHCGSANPQHARFCAKCGQPLIDADAMNAGREKSKRMSAYQAPNAAASYAQIPDFAPMPAPAPQSKGWGVAYAFAAIARLGTIAAMFFMTFFSQSRWLVVLPLLTGFLVEAVRHPRRHRENIGSVLVEIMTAGIVTGIYATLLYTSQVGILTDFLLSVILLFWFLVEAVRS